MDVSKLLQDFRKTLVRRAELEFFDEFILPHSTLIFDSALRLSKNQVAGQELAHKVFLYAIKNSRQLKESPKSQNWLFAILRTLFLEEDESEKNIEDEIDFYSSIIEKENEFEKSIPKGLDKLDAKLKKAIEMFYREGLSCHEISEVLNLPVGTVMSRIARGKVHLRRN